MNLNDIKALHKSQDAAQLGDDMRKLLADPSGRRLLMRLVTMSGVYRTSTGRTDLELAYEASRRDLGLEILSVANRANPQAVVQATSERSDILRKRHDELTSTLKEHQP